MVKILLFFVVFFYIYFKFGLHLTIHLFSIFKKGFKKETDDYGIMIACGKQGSGKTFYLVDYVERNRNGKKVITNIKSYSDNNDYVIYNSDLFDIINKFNTGVYNEEYIILYDELFSVVNKNTKIPKELMTFISELRKRHLYFLTSVQEWLDVHVTFRRYCRYVINCKMFNIFGNAFMYNTISSGYLMKYDKDEAEYLAPIISSSFYKCNREISSKYDTYEVI